MSLASLSSTLFSLGVIFVALGFAAHVGHAVMLANIVHVASSAGLSFASAFASPTAISFFASAIWVS